MIDAANYLAIETLRDGRTITIRAQRPGDLDGWRAALARTSERHMALPRDALRGGKLPRLTPLDDNTRTQIISTGGK